MNGRYLLDTNIVIAVFAADSAVLDRLDTAHEVFVPFVVLGELYYGARKSARSQSNLARIDEFTSATSILTSSLETAKVYGSIKNGLRSVGRPIPENDIWIAAIALENNLTLISRDKHFSAIPELKIDWW